MVEGSVAGLLIERISMIVDLQASGMLCGGAAGFWLDGLDVKTSEGGENVRVGGFVQSLKR